MVQKIGKLPERNMMGLKMETKQIQLKVKIYIFLIIKL